MKERQRILIEGRNWNDIVSLPCFRELSHYGDGDWSLLVRADYRNGKEVSREDGYYGIRASVGDTLVEYGNGKWGVDRTKATDKLKTEKQ